MRLRVVLALAFSASSFVVAAPASAQIMQAYVPTGVYPVAPGVNHESGIAAASAGIQQVNILTVDPGAPDLHFEASLPFDKVSAREKVTDQAIRQSTEGHRVIAAVNANLWSTWGDFTLGNLAYSPIGLAIANGELITSGNGPTPAFGVKPDGTPLIGSPTVSVQLTLPSSGVVVPITEVNRHRDPEELVLYTSRFDTHTWTDPYGVEVVLETGGVPITDVGSFTFTVTEVRADIGDALIGPTQVVLSGAGTPAEWLRWFIPGETVTLTTSIDAAWSDVTEAVGGAEILVQGGQPQYYSPRRPDAVYKPHPRTAIGIRADGGLIAVAVDGRSSASRGVTNAEMGELLLSLGAVDALNLDGGGSTTMAVRQPGDVEVSVVNRPSDGDEREVSTSLQLVSTTRTRKLSNVLVTTGAPNIYVGETHQLIAKGHDAKYNGVVLDQSLASWTGQGDAATVSEGGLLYARAVGRVEVNLTYGEGGEFSATREFQVLLLDRAPPIITPPTAGLAPDPVSGVTSMGLTVTWAATDVDGVVVSMQLQQRPDDGLWRSVALATPLATSVRRTAAFGNRYQFRARATDDSGNTSQWTYGPTYRIDSIEAPSTILSPFGTWLYVATTRAIGGVYGRSDVRTQPQPWAAGAYTGIQAALIGVMAPKTGFAQVFYDGTDMGGISLYRSTKRMRSVLFVTAISDLDQPTQQHWLDVRNVSIATRPFMDLDALLVLTAELPAV